MWSGPRNISTAMMRAWENRGDCAVVDEPLYACYLAATGLDHPGRDAVLASQSRDWREVAAQLTGPIPGGKSLFYQKHMTHHLLPQFGRDWLDQLTHVFLIRDPRKVVASYVKSRPEISVEDIGVLQQFGIWQQACATSASPPLVIDADEFLQAPEAQLRALCRGLDIDFSERMLHWRAGKRDSDGVWAPWWYAAVEASTGFAAPAADVPVRLTAPQQAVADACMDAWQQMRVSRIR